MCHGSSVLRLDGGVLVGAAHSFDFQHLAQDKTGTWKLKKCFLMRERNQAEVMGMGQLHVFLSDLRSIGI